MSPVSGTSIVTADRQSCLQTLHRSVDLGLDLFPSQLGKLDPVNLPLPSSYHATPLLLLFTSYTPHATPSQPKGRSSDIMANPAPSVFIFMDPLDKPSAGKSEKVKREVRSHVTSRTHRKRKEQETLEVEALVKERWEAQMRNGLMSAPCECDLEEKEREQQQERLWDGQGEDKANIWQSDVVKKERNEDFHHPQSLEPTFRPNVTHSDDLWNPMISAVRGGPVAFHLHLLNDPSNEIGSIFHDLKIDALGVVVSIFLAFIISSPSPPISAIPPYILESTISYSLHLLAHQTCYQTIANTQALEWEQQFQPLTTPGKAQHFLPAAVFQDPALVSAWCLIGTAQLLLHQDSRLEPRIVQGILRLRGHAIRDINLALDDPSRATSDVLIVAVLLLATADALHGFRESYPLHMAGLMEMINAKGGFSALGFGGCLEAFSKSTSPSFCIHTFPLYIHLACRKKQKTRIWDAREMEKEWEEEALLPTVLSSSYRESSRLNSSYVCFLLTVRELVLWQDAMIARKVGGRPYGHLAKHKSPLPSPAV